MEADINTIRKELKSIITDDNTRVLFKTRPVLNQLLNLDIVAYMVKRGKTKKNKNGKKGVMMTFFRTHPYLYNLMRKRKIDTETIVFIDPLFNISGDTRKYSDQAIIIPCPFARNFEDNIMDALSDVDGIGYLMIDDIVALQNYWDLKRIERFLERLSKKLAELGDPPILIIADCTKDDNILKLAGSICDKVVLVNGMKKNKMVKKKLAVEKN
jgi:hypothetical protein